MIIIILQFPYCYLCSSFEARSKIMLGGETYNLHEKEFRLCTFYYERVNFKSTGNNFMTVFIARRDAACF